MIKLDMAKKTDMRVTTKEYHLENDIITLEFDAGDYDLAGKIITAAFSPAKVETAPLEVVGGIIKLPIYANSIQYGINYIQLNFRWDANRLEQSGKIMWMIDRSLETVGPTPEELDIITYLITQANSVVDAAGAVRIALDKSVDDANTAKSALEDTIDSADTAKGDLEGAIETAGTAKVNLEGTISDANTAKTNLNDKIGEAGTAQTSLNDKIGEAGTAKSELQAVIDNSKIGDLSQLKTADKSSLVGAINTHLADNMPHQIADITNSKTYRYGLQVQNGKPQIIYEEVI